MSVRNLPLFEGRLNTYNHNCLLYNNQGGLHMANEDTRYRSQEYNSAARDRLEGSMKEAGGRVKVSVGVLAGNERLKAKGRGDQVSGAARRKKGSYQSLGRPTLNVCR
jgi:uncharacterized protein YjbJ (UPF0337 family)